MRIILFILVFIVAITSFFSGILLMLAPHGSFFQMSTSILKDSPFTTFMIPGFCLAFLVGGSNTFALIELLHKAKERYNWCIVGGIMLSGWMVVQIFLVGWNHWLQVAYLVTGIMILLISLQLKGKWLA